MQQVRGAINLKIEHHQSVEALWKVRQKNKNEKNFKMLNRKKKKTRNTGCDAITQHTIL